MPTALYILTGASRGLGAAIAEQLLGPDVTLLCISRSANPALEAKAQKAGATLLQWQRDLADAEPAAQALESWLGEFDATGISEANLINNAAVISRIGPVDRADNADLARAVRVGIEAPLLLSAAFLRATAGWKSPRRILNISSGLGRRAMAGSASYCAVKAAIDHLSRAMALDEATRPNGARIVALAPGVIDTDMQVQLRNADAAGFPDRSTFVSLQEQGQLNTPADAAAKVLQILKRTDFGSEVITDVRSA